MTSHPVPTVRLLLVDDDEDDFWLTNNYLQDIQHQSFEIDWASTYAQAMSKLSTQPYDICLTDFLLGAKTGLDLLQEAQKLGSQVPMVLLTGRGDRLIDQEAMRLGAVDYLVKSELDAEKLDRCIRYTLERTANLRALQESERRYRTLFEQAKDVVLISDEMGKLLFYNESAIEVFGFSPEELLQMDISQFFVEDEQWKTFLKQLQQHGQVRDLEVTLRTKYQELKYCIVAAAQQPNGHYQGIIHDITTRKKAEQEQFRTEKLAATSRLVRALAHEVRNPLNNIQLSAEQLHLELPNEETLPYIQIIRRNVHRINDLIGELLNSARPAEMECSPVWVHQLLDDTLQLAQDRIQLKGVSVHKHYAPQDCCLLLDKTKIEIALLNLVINALEAMDGPERNLRIRTESLREGGCIVYLSDTGRGIPPAYLGRLFEPYFSSKSNGIGLGLATTLNFLQAHRATIEVTSKVNVGTTFEIHFPAPHQADKV
jgi:PAS domain S-box-containing protein